MTSNWRERVEAIRSSKRLALGVVVTAVFVDNLLYSLLIPLIPFYMKELDVSQSAMGSLTAVFALANIFVTPFLGPVIDKFGKRLTMTVGLSMQIFAVFVFIFSTNYWMLMLARLLQGCSSAVAWTAGLVLLGDVYPEDQQGSAVGLAMTFSGLGYMSGPPVCGALYDLTGTHYGPYLTMTGFLAIDLALRFFMKDPVHLHSDEEKKSLREAKVIFKNLRLLLLGFCGIVGGAVFAGLEPILIVELTNRYQYSSFWTSLILIALIASYTVATPLTGKLIDKYVSKRTVIMVTALVTVALITPLNGFEFPVWLTTISLFVQGVVWALMVVPQLPLVNSIIDTEYKGHFRGTIISCVNMMWAMGSFLGPILASYLTDTYSFMTALLVLSGMCFVASVLIAIFLLRKPKSNYQVVSTNEAIEGKENINIEKTNNIENDEEKQGEQEQIELENLNEIENEGTKSLKGNNERKELERIDV